MSNKYSSTKNNKSSPLRDNMGGHFVNSTNEAWENYDRKNEVVFHADWTTITAWGLDWQAFYDICVWPYTQTELINQYHGGRWYHETWGTTGGFMIRAKPIDLADPDRCTIEIPGGICELMGYQGMQNVLECLRTEVRKFDVSRFDLAADNCPFKPQQLYDDVYENKIRTKTQRTHLRRFDSPFEPDDLGNIGNCGITLGGRQSDRYFRCYDKHGYTRLEIEFKGDYAKKTFIAFLMTGDFSETCLELIRDFIDFLDAPIDELRLKYGTRVDLRAHLAEYWQKFVGAVGRYSTRSKKSAREVAIEDIIQNVRKYLSAPFSMIADFGPLCMDEIISMLMVDGRYRRGRNPKYRGLLLELYPPAPLMPKSA